MSDANPASAWYWGDYVLDPARRRLTCKGEPVEIEDRVFDLLALLLQHREQPLDRQELSAAIWGKRPVSDATLRQLVYAARRAVGDDGESQHTISTLYGRGLQWVAPVEMVFEARDAVTPASRRAGVALEAGSDKSQPASGTAVVGSSPRRASRRRVMWMFGALVVLIVAGFVVWRLGFLSRATTPAVADQATTLAVLPFDMLNAPDQRYLSDGLTEELVDRLARMPRLRVKARSSAFELRGKQVSAREAARLLGVDHVLEGSIQRSGDKWRVRVALVDARDGYERWSDVFDIGAGDLLGMEDKITGHVVAALYPKLDPASSLRMLAAKRIDPSAHHEYMVGLEYLRLRTPEDFAQAVTHFRRAIATAPDYADAWSGLAMTYAIWTDHDNSKLPDTYTVDALDAAQQAVKLDPDLGRAHAVLAYLYTRQWQWDKAAGEYRRALQLDPDDAMARHWYSIYLMYVNDVAASSEQSRRALELDPLSPILNATLGRQFLYAGRTQDAIAQLRKTVALAPRFVFAHIILAYAYMADNQGGEAVKEVRRAVALSADSPPPSVRAALGVALSSSGDQAGAQAQLAALEARSRTQYVSGASLADLFSQLGMRDKVFGQLLRAVAQHDPLMQPIIASRSSWWYSDPRFAEVRARMDLSAH